MKTVDEALDVLAEEYGEDPDDIAETYIEDSICPGVCMNDDCKQTYEYEPDSKDGWCNSCKTNSVESLYILMGVI